MKINFISLSFILVIICTISCNKEQSFELGTSSQNLPMPSVLSSVRIAKFFEIDTTQTAPLDTVYKEFYSYDALNRIIKKTSLQLKPNGDSSDYNVFNYVYNAIDTLAQKVFIQQKYFSTTVVIINDTIFYTYFNNKIIKDSITSSEGYYDTEIFTYNLNYITRIFNEVDAGMAYSSNGTSKIYQTKINNNITAQTDTFVSSNNIFPTSINYNKFSATVSYINNPNPLYSIATATRRNYLSDDLGLAGDAAPEKLITQQQYSLSKWTNNGPVSVVTNSQINYIYNFRSDGYPSTGTMVKVSNGITKKTKLLFLYQ